MNTSKRVPSATAVPLVVCTSKGRRGFLAASNVASPASSQMLRRLAVYSTRATVAVLRNTRESSGSTMVRCWPTPVV